MFLKELEIYGFKSFPKRTKFSFNAGITAIVGPNGCGKSNIADAVRWVLGEQNIRSLRGKKLTDIIYSGNHNGKPLNLAEVSMTLDNSKRILPLEREEISIKRRVFRSGETENFINGLPCKLKEIQNLLLNTGLGKNTYSMIAQGEIDIVLSAKPSDRRYLFEEAASISRYKYEKQNILKRIEETSINLEKIDNILSEIKNQLIALEEEADQLNIYKDYKEKIRNSELFLLWQRYNACKTYLLKIKKNMKVYQADRMEKLKTFKKEEIEINKLQKEIENLKKQLDTNQIKNNELTQVHNNTQNQLNIELEKKNELNLKIIDINRDIKNTKEKISSIEKNIENKDKKITEIRQSINHLNEKQKKQQIKHNEDAKLIEKIMRLKNINQKMINNIRKKDLLINEKKIKAETTLNLLKKNLTQTQTRKSVLKKELNIINNQINHYIEKNETDNVENTKKYLEKNEEKLKEIKDKISRVNLLMEKNTQMVYLKEERMYIIKKSIKDTEEGNGKQIKEFYTRYKQKYSNNLCEKLIDIIEDIPRDLEKAIEVALKDSLNTIIVGNLSSALNIIHSLSREDLSDIKIIPLDKMEKIAEINEIKMEEDLRDILGIADKMVKYPEKYKKLFNTLLGNTIIVKSNSIAIELSEKYMGRCRIISLEGMIIRKDGTIHFYIDKKIEKNNLFYFKKELNNLIKELKNIEKSIVQNRELSEKYNNIHKYLLQENNKIKKSLDEYGNKIVGKKENINELHFQMNDLKRNIENINLEESNTLKEIDQISKKYQFYNNNYHRINKCKNNIEQSFRMINQIVLEKNKQLNIMEKNINDIKNEIIIKEERIKNLQDREEDIQLQIAELELLLKRKKSDKQKDAEKWDDILKNIELHNKKLNQLKYKDTDTQKILEGTRKNIWNKSELLENILSRRKELQESCERIKEQQHREELLEVQYSEKYENIKKEATKDYQISIDGLENNKKTCSSKKEANQQITELREKIIEMGQINFDAGNRYQHQLDKFNALQGKYDEIIEAKKSLLQLVSNIDNIAAERFKNTFNQVKIYFNEIFQRMFSGGEGILKLNHNDDISQSEIDIIACPPGKKTRNIELLSSGEKALIAIALLLALWKVNPSPFCLFDEIDTALDETNADKLSMILKGKDLNKSQLIVITHQKSTMEAADTLCGITMQDSGISKLVSVKLTK